MLLKMDVYIDIYGNIFKNGYITKMTTVCPTEVGRWVCVEIELLNEFLPMNADILLHNLHDILNDMGASYMDNLWNE